MLENNNSGAGVEVQRGEERRSQKSLQASFTGEERRNAVADRRHENNQQYATFYVDDHYFGIEVLKVQEVLTIQEITHVPLASQGVAGLINLRGHIVVALDLRSILRFPQRSDADGGMNVVIQTGDGPLSFLVDRIGDVIEVVPDLFEPSPESLDDGLAAVVDGVYKLKSQLLLILNTDKIINLED